MFEEFYFQFQQEFINFNLSENIIEMKRWRTNRIFSIFWKIVVFLVIFIFIYNFIPKYYFEELKKSIFYKPDEIIENPSIERRLSGSPDIGILVIVTNDANLSEYKIALDSLRCYSQLQNYDFNLVFVDDYWRKKCPQKQFMFQRHCITSNLLSKHDWTLFIDADVGVVNPNRLLDDFVIQLENHVDILFFDRFFDWEIAAGSYFARNTSFASEFLMKFSNMEEILPNSFVGSDNGAIHWLFLTEFFTNQTSIFSKNDCWKILEKSKDFTDLFVFEACCRQIIGENQILKSQTKNGHVKILPKGTGWMRDAWITNSKWSLEYDFMLHGWKTSIMYPLIENSTSWNRALIRNKWGKWYQTLAMNNFSNYSCKNGKIKWKWWKSLMLEKEEIIDLLEKRKFNVRNDFYYHVSLIPYYLT